jgi:hypothetical protein
MLWSESLTLVLPLFGSILPNNGRMKSFVLEHVRWYRKLGCSLLWGWCRTQTFTMIDILQKQPSRNMWYQICGKILCKVPTGTLHNYIIIFTTSLLCSFTFTCIQACCNCHPTNIALAAVCTENAHRTSFSPWTWQLWIVTLVHSEYFYWTRVWWVIEHQDSDQLKISNWWFWSLISVNAPPSLCSVNTGGFSWYPWSWSWSWSAAKSLMSSQTNYWEKYNSPFWILINLNSAANSSMVNVNEQWVTLLFLEFCILDGVGGVWVNDNRQQAND